MRKATGGFDGHARSPMRSASALFCCILTFAGLAGCPMDGGNGNGNNPDSLTGSIVSLISDITLSGNQTLSIVYSADPNATSVEAFYVEVESTAADAPTVGAEVVFATDLSTGDGQVTSLQTGSIPTGLYRVGLNLAAGSLSAKVFSQGSFRISTLPVPVFSLPNQNITRIAGTDPVQIQASLGDPENAVNWRVFFIPNGLPTDGIPAGQLGTMIGSGRANEAIVSWATAGVANGEYMVGISVTDSGQSVVETSADGNEDRIETVLNPFIITFADEPPPPRPPLVQVTKPSGPETLFAGETTLVQFSATFFEGPPEFYEIDVFYDFDGIADTGDEVIFSPNLPPAAVSAVFSVDMIDVGDVVRFGVTASDGLNDPITVYAQGSVTFGTPAAASLTCTQPSSLLNVKPNEGSVNVNWQTTGISSAAGGNFDVFLRRTNASNMPTGPEIPVLTDAPLTQFSTMFMPSDVGKFQVSVRVTLSADPSNPLEDACPSLITVSSLPNVLWLGSLDLDQSADPPFDGAIFEGVNFEDNAGSSFAGAVDFNEDGFDEFTVVARYGKPEFVNPTGIGSGEAYFFRGRTTRYLGLFSLNGVGSAIMPGLVFSGIEAFPSNETDGMSSVLFTGDADGDDTGEIAFGFPRATSQSVNTLGGQIEGLTFCGLNPIRTPIPDGMGGFSYEHIPQFHRGGVVIASSQNRVLATSTDDALGRRVKLDNVGQWFDVHFGAVGAQLYAEISPEPGQGTICGGDSTWLDDVYEWDMDDDCPPDAIGGTVGCKGTSDGSGQDDVLTEPDFGFDPRLADPWSCLPYLSLAADPACLNTWDEGCPACDAFCDPGFGTTCDCNPFDPTLPDCRSTRDLVGIGGCPADPPVGIECEDEKDVAMMSIPVGLPEISFFIQSGFYRERISGIPTLDPDDDEMIDWNDIVEEPILNTIPQYGLIGARIIGRQVNDAGGTTMTQSDDDLIITSPFANEVNDDGGTAYVIPFFPSEIFSSGPRVLSRYWQLETFANGLNYDPRLYGVGGSPVSPHQYLLGGNSHFGSRPGETSIIHSDTGDLNDVRIFGDESELLRIVVGIPDLNRDGRNDIAIGSPLADVDGNGTSEGAVYVVFRRARSLEGQVNLADLKRSVSDPERLAGLLIREDADDEQRFGESVAGGFDFNQDSIGDIVIGNPDGNSGTGEIIIVFGSSATTSSQNGITIEGPNGLLARRQGARIRGFEIGAEFGFNVANIGDIDGDGLNDLAIAAPNASPTYDSDITDNIDSLDPAANPFALPGVDLDLDGLAEDVSGPRGIPDGLVNVNDELRRSGIVYIILGNNDARAFAVNSQSPMDISIGELGTADLAGFVIVGRRGERFAPGDISGAGGIVHAGDFLGGGFAGDTTRTIPSAGITVEYGGNLNKNPVTFTSNAGTSLVRERGRSSGIGKAGDVDGDGLGDFLIGSQLADPRVDNVTGEGQTNGGEAYLIYGFTP